MTRATDDKLGELHGAVATVLTEALTAGVKVVGKDGEVEQTTAPASYIVAAIQFLKNNNITAAAGNDELDALDKALEARRARKNQSISPKAMEEAADLMDRMVGGPLQ